MHAGVDPLTAQRRTTKREVSKSRRRRVPCDGPAMRREVLPILIRQADRHRLVVPRRVIFNIWERSGCVREVGAPADRKNARKSTSDENDDASQGQTHDAGEKFPRTRHASSVRHVGLPSQPAAGIACSTASSLAPPPAGGSPAASKRTSLG